MSDAFAKLEERYGIKDKKEESSRGGKFELDAKSSSSKVADQLK